MKFRYKDLLQSPIWFSAFILIIVFVCELAVMFLLLLLPPFSAWLEAFVDATLLTLLLFPVIYLSLLRPLFLYIATTRESGESIKHAAEESSRLAELGKLVSSMAHEVNNPLMIISGNAQLSLMEEIQSDAVKNNLKIIIEESQRAKDIIQRLLRFSRPSKGETKEVDINKNIEAVVGIVEHQFKLVNVEIKRNYQENLPLISIDEQQMQEVFMNLLNNAAEAMPNGGVITISTSLERDFLRLDFQDTGSGMSGEVKKKALEPFFTTKEKGTGLGLSVCYGILKAHNAELKFESELNKGTTVTVLLPLGGGKA